MAIRVGGPMFETAKSELFKKQECLRCHYASDGAHYSLFQIIGDMGSLRALFPDGTANEFNFVLFSTSGVHGSYTTIEEVEASLKKYGENPTDDDCGAEDFRLPELTVLIVQPEICCLRYGCVRVALADIDYLKALRQSSWAIVQKIGSPSANDAPNFSTTRPQPTDSITET